MERAAQVEGPLVETVHRRPHLLGQHLPLRRGHLLEQLVDRRAVAVDLEDLGVILAEVRRQAVAATGGPACRRCPGAIRVASGAGGRLSTSFQLYPACQSFMYWGSSPKPAQMPAITSDQLGT